MAKIDHSVTARPDDGEKFIVLDDMPGLLAELAGAQVPGSSVLCASVGLGGKIKRIWAEGSAEPLEEPTRKWLATAGPGVDGETTAELDRARLDPARLDPPKVALARRGGRHQAT
jgi:hypothetical protein